MADGKGQGAVHGTVGLTALFLVLIGVLILFRSPAWGLAAAQGTTDAGLFALPYVLFGLVLLVTGLVGAVWSFFPVLKDVESLWRHTGSR